MRTILGVAGAIALLAIAYYFAVALPEQNRANLQLERDKFNHELEEKKAKALEEAQKESQRAFGRENAQTEYDGCLEVVTKKFNRDLELNGTPIPGKPGTYNAPSAIMNEIQKQEAENKEACRRQYETKLKAIEAK
jgi:hypothetical protein